MFQHAASYNGYLTELCQAAHADEADSIGNKLFPAVGVRTAVGTYKKRDIGNAFRVYRTALARGNSPTRIDTNATDGFYNCRPHALEVGTWKFDADQDDGGEEERESNLQELMSTQLVTREFQAVSIFKAGVPVTSGAGIWSGEAGAAANIINELDTLAITIQAGIGRRPTHLIFGPERLDDRQKPPQPARADPRADCGGFPGTAAQYADLPRHQHIGGIHALQPGSPG